MEVRKEVPNTKHPPLTVTPLSPMRGDHGATISEHRPIIAGRGVLGVWDFLKELSPCLVFVFAVLMTSSNLSATNHANFTASLFSKKSGIYTLSEAWSGVNWTDLILSHLYSVQSIAPTIVLVDLS